jgi:hypothetical protein
MYARLVIFKVGPGNRSTIEKLVDEFDPLYRAQRGSGTCLSLEMTQLVSMVPSAFGSQRRMPKQPTP